ncbi:MAG TPA: site-specific integrase [Verrucomicrobiota bacterium]|nr:site-specific integrase [Verrucomicrobiota bacterium]HNU52690.1 site-specific integrase [Verrucomicrobiota bacterium]
MQESETETKPGKPSFWQSTRHAFLIRHRNSRSLYLNVRLNGRLIRKSLKTKSITVGRLRLAKELGAIRQAAARRSDLDAGRKLTLCDCIALYRERVEASATLKPATRKFYREVLVEIERTFDRPGRDVREIETQDCLTWAGDFARRYNATRYNAAVGILRRLFAVAVEKGLRTSNPASSVRKARVRRKELKLPSVATFAALVRNIETAGGRFSHDCADLVRFLAFSGCRIAEANQIRWADVDIGRDELVVRGDPKAGTKNWEARRVPLNPELRALLERIRSERPNEPDGAPVLVVRECLKSLHRACDRLGIPRLTHHDLRHFHATRCLESGVPVATVAAWLGHKDGGALLLKTYSHLRTEHSAAMAARVSFSPNAEPTAPNVVSLMPRSEPDRLLKL